MLFRVAQQIGMDQIHFCIFMVTSLGLGFITPPMGLNLFVVSSLTGAAHHDHRALRFSVRDSDDIRLGADRIRSADVAVGDPVVPSLEAEISRVTPHRLPLTPDLALYATSQALSVLAVRPVLRERRSFLRYFFKRFNRVLHEAQAGSAKVLRANVAAG